MSDHATERTLTTRLDAAVAQSQRLPDVAEIADVVEGVMQTMDGDLSPASVKLYAEVEALAKYIADARAEIAALHPEEIRDRHLATATDELDAIVEATEQATHGILEAVEAIEGMTTSMAPEVAEGVSEAVTKVYESCNFQDITGQRITKVVKALQHIEKMVEGLLAAFGSELGSRRRPAPVEDGPRGDAALLNGPQLATNAASQDDIDKMLFGG